MSADNNRNEAIAELRDIASPVGLWMATKGAAFAVLVTAPSPLTVAEADAASSRIADQCVAAHEKAKRARAAERTKIR